MARKRKGPRKVRKFGGRRFEKVVTHRKKSTAEATASVTRSARQRSARVVKHAGGWTVYRGPKLKR